jgi:hypothetical protein
MRQALFGAAHAVAPRLSVHDPMPRIPDVVIMPPAPAIANRRKKPSQAFTPRLRVTLQVGNLFEGAMRPMCTRPIVRQGIIYIPSSSTSDPEEELILVRNRESRV